jgi:hypothetical protein
MLVQPPATFRFSRLYNPRKKRMTDMKLIFEYFRQNKNVRNASSRCWDDRNGNVAVKKRRQLEFLEEIIYKGRGLFYFYGA